jgi:hypothetical protein
MPIPIKPCSFGLKIYFKLFLQNQKWKIWQDEIKKGQSIIEMNHPRYFVQA